MIVKRNGFALPVALFVLLVVGMIAAILSMLTTRSLGIGQTSQDSFAIYQLSEAMVNEAIRNLIISPNVWFKTSPLTPNPKGYTPYSPSSFQSTGGIPPCSGVDCERNLYPYGGGLIKNVGPINKGGLTVDPQVPITQQAKYGGDTSTTADIDKNGTKGFYQIERLEEIPLSTDSIGANLDAQAGSGAAIFRVTGTASSTLKGKTSSSTVVALVQVEVY